MKDIKNIFTIGIFALATAIVLAGCSLFTNDIDDWGGGPLIGIDQLNGSRYGITIYVEKCSFDEKKTWEQILQYVTIEPSSVDADGGVQIPAKGDFSSANYAPFPFTGDERGFSSALLHVRLNTPFSGPGFIKITIQEDAFSEIKATARLSVYN